MAFKHHISSFCFLLILLLGCDKEERPLRIAVANSVRPAAEALIARCPELDGKDVELVFASSGRLSAQIRNGAPFDLFMGADTKYPERLHEDGRTTGPPKVFATNVPVLQGSIRGRQERMDPIEMLRTASWNKLAVADPESSPFGRLTEQLLKKEALIERVQSKRVFGSGISEVDRFFRTGNVELAITSRSTAMESKGEWIPFQGYRLKQAMIPIAEERSAQQERSLENFRAFVRSRKGRAILRECGHGIPEEQEEKPSDG